MSTFVTEISQQTITIDGIHYTTADATASAPETKSLLQTKFRTIYGENSFYAALADFLAEWFDGNDTLKVHTSGSTGTPKELWVEKAG